MSLRGQGTSVFRNADDVVTLDQVGNRNEAIAAVSIRFGVRVEEPVCARRHGEVPIVFDRPEQHDGVGLEDGIDLMLQVAEDFASNQRADDAEVLKHEQTIGIDVQVVHDETFAFVPALHA